MLESIETSRLHSRSGPCTCNALRKVASVRPREPPQARIEHRDKSAGIPLGTHAAAQAEGGDGLAWVQLYTPGRRFLAQALTHTLLAIRRASQSWQGCVFIHGCVHSNIV